MTGKTEAEQTACKGMKPLKGEINMVETILVAALVLVLMLIRNYIIKKIRQRKS